MTDLERVLINLDGIAVHLEREGFRTLAGCAREAVQMLKDREPTTPNIVDGFDAFCGKCGHSLNNVSRFCDVCGTEVKWND